MAVEKRLILSTGGVTGLPLVMGGKAVIRQVLGEGDRRWSVVPGVCVMKK